MELKILEEKDNALFNRKEIKGTIQAEITPSRIEVEKLLSEKFSSSPETIKIKGIYGRFGSKTFNIEAKIYASKEDKDAIEQKSKKEKAQEKLAKEKPAEAAQEAPKEEIKPEEKPVEEKSFANEDDKAIDNKEEVESKDTVNEKDDSSYKIDGSSNNKNASLEVGEADGRKSETKSE